MTFFGLLSIVLALSGGTMALLTQLARSPFGAAHALRPSKNHSVPPAKYWRTVSGNAVFSLGLVFGLSALLGPWLFTSGPVSVLRCIVEGVVILALFDFFYYLLHRYPFHAWSVLRSVHAVHHTAKNPVALDSLYMHPIENALGLGLLWVCVCAVRVVAGPVHVYAFMWMFLWYSILNVVVHAGFDPRSAPMWLFTSFARRHNKHHVGMQGKNFASVTPLWDVVFRTEEP